jgi:LacI family transcriptional regulator
MISLKDIAKKCGVSTATVSKALNDQKDIGEDTKARIKKTAEEMGYLPNSAARALKTKRSYNIGVLFRDDARSGLTHEYFSGVLDGIMVEAETLGYDITFINTHSEIRQMSYLEHCRYRNFDGVIIVCVDFNNPGVQELMNNNRIPVITVDYLHQNCTAVSSNNVKGIEELVRYIYEKGHRKIAYIHGQHYSFVTKERLASFYRISESLGLEIPDEYVLEADYLETKATTMQTRNLLKLKERPTCIIYPDDTSLVGGLNAINEAGLSIPEDISVAGYDGAKIAQILRPKVTTIRQNTAEIGKEAANHLIQQIEKPKTTLVERVVIDGELLTGQSVGSIPDLS